MKKKPLSFEFYAIAGYYSTANNGLGNHGQINSYFLDAFKKISQNFVWIVAAIVLLIFIIWIYKIINNKIQLNRQARELDKAFAIKTNQPKVLTQ